jgi:hypothetical protein
MPAIMPKRRIALTVVVAAVLWAVAGGVIAQGQTTTSPAKVRAVGTIKSITGNTIMLTADAGAETTILIQPATRLLRTAPGQTDLKTASPIQLSDVQVGDRLLAVGTASDDGKSVTATSAVVMKKGDVAAKQEHEREDWQKRGVGGVVKAVDAATGTITISTGAVGANNTLDVHISKATIIRRYSPDSVKFDDARPGTLDQIKAGDQLRARGTKNEDGKQLAAEEIVSGTFRNVAGTVVATDGSNSTITVTDLATKRPVTMKITADSQMHKLPPMMAQRIAMRLKGIEPGAPSAAGNGGAQSPARSGGTQPPGTGAGGRPGGPRPGGGADFQQMLNRMPKATLADLQKGDAVMIVATEGSAETPSSAIILLSGVEPILAAAPTQASTILSPWNLSASGNIGTGDTP